MRSSHLALQIILAVWVVIGLWAVPAQASVGPPSTPVPAALWLGLATLAGMGGVALPRKKIRGGGG